MTITIADVLHYAADEVLNDTIELFWYRAGRENFSCCAIRIAVSALEKDHYIASAMIKDIMEGLRKMGLNTDSCTAFNRFNLSTHQGARYNWLKFAALIAEEQGV